MRSEVDFAFVGNTDFFDASVTLSHQMLGGKLDVLEEFRKINSRQQNEDMRPLSGKPELDQIPYESDFLCENNLLCANKPDEAVLKETKRLMLLNILKHHNKAIRFSTLPPLPLVDFEDNIKVLRMNDANCQSSPSSVERIRKRNKFIF